MEERLNKYLQKPVQILWFGSDEFVLVVTTIFVAVIVGGLVGWAFIAALLLFLPWKRAQPRGFLAHLAWRWGMLHFRHYPGPTQTRFYERSEEHTSELQSLMRISYAVFCLKKKNNTITINQQNVTSTQK